MSRGASQQPGPSISASLSASGASRRGPSKVVNEDCYDFDADAGLFIVADGVGGHEDGAVASRSVVEVIMRGLDPDLPLSEQAEAAAALLKSLNTQLVAEAAARGGRVLIGSTVVLLLVIGRHAVCLWAGDSRLYLLRDERFYLLTKDHTLAAISPNAAGASETLTRAVGSSAELDLDRIVIEVSDGDRFLLCSDGINKIFDDNDLASLLDAPPGGLAERILARAAIEGLRDDTTLVVVDVTLPSIVTGAGDG